MPRITVIPTKVDTLEERELREDILSVEILRRDSICRAYVQNIK